MANRSGHVRLQLAGADTRIILSDKKSYYVHAVQLRSSSAFFARMLDPAQQKHLVVLQNHDSYSGEEIEPELRYLPVREGEEESYYSLMHENEDSSVRKSLFHDYHRIICTIFGKGMKLKTGDMVSLLRDCVGLVEIAEYLEVVSKTCIV